MQSQLPLPYEAEQPQISGHKVDDYKDVLGHAGTLHQRLTMSIPILSKVVSISGKGTRRVFGGTLRGGQLPFQAGGAMFPYFLVDSRPVEGGQE